MGLNEEKLFEAVNLQMQGRIVLGNEQSDIMGKWEVKPAQKRACQSF